MVVMLRKGFVVLGAELLLTSCGPIRANLNKTLPSKETLEPNHTNAITVEKRAEIAASGDRRIFEANNRFGLQLLEQQTKEMPGSFCHRRYAKRIVAVRWTDGKALIWNTSYTK